MPETFCRRSKVGSKIWRNKYNCSKEKSRIMRLSLTSRWKRIRIWETGSISLRKKVKVSKKNWRTEMSSWRLSRKRRTSTIKFLKKNTNISVNSKRDCRSKWLKLMLWRQILKNPDKTSRKLKLNSRRISRIWLKREKKCHRKSKLWGRKLKKFKKKRLSYLNR